MHHLRKVDVNVDCSGCLHIHLIVFIDLVVSDILTFADGKRHIRWRVCYGMDRDISRRENTSCPCGNATAVTYRNQVLRPHVLPLIYQRNRTLQNDNARPRVSMNFRDFLAKKVSVLDWPPYSPDLSPIMHLWDERNRRVKLVRCILFNILFQNFHSCRRDQCR